MSANLHGHPGPARAGTTRWLGTRHLIEVLLFCGVLLASLGYTFSTPLIGAPDERAQIVEAAATVRGEINLPEDAAKESLPKVPKYIAQLRIPCEAAKPKKPACSEHIGNSAQSTVSSTQFSNYPPLYFLLVGIPTLFMRGIPAVYAVRVVSAVLNSALVALGLILLRRYGRRTVAAAALVAVTPMVLFLNGVVNESGFEISAAFATWCGLLCIARWDGEVPRFLVVVTAVVTVAFALSRPDSLPYLLITLVITMIVAGTRQMRDLARQPLIRRMGVVIAAALAIAGISLLVLGTPRLLGLPAKHPLPLSSELHITLHRMWQLGRQAVGDFGWLDTIVTLPVFHLWLAAVALLVGYALLVSPRGRVALVVLAAAAFAAPLVEEAPHINQVGAYWQGRYWLPLLMGLPLVAASCAATRRLRPLRLPALARIGAGAAVALVLFAAQLSTFLRSLQRNRVGLGLPAGSPVRWNPPSGPGLGTTLFIVGYAILVLFVVDQQRRPHVPMLSASPMSQPADGQAVHDGLGDGADAGGSQPGIAADGPSVET